MQPTHPIPPYRVLVTGSRDWTSRDIIFYALDWLLAERGQSLVIVHGACPRGADAIADEWARLRNVPVERYPANWSPGGVFNRAAGHRRNSAMVHTVPAGCRAFIRNNSPGATGCAAAAERAGIATYRYFTTD